MESKYIYLFRMKITIGVNHSDHIGGWTGNDPGFI